MPTKIRQNTQAWNSGTYDDTIAPTLADFETNPVNLEEDFNNLRSQVNNMLNAQTGNWYDNPFIGGSPDLPISGTSSLNQVPIGCFTDLLTNVTVSNTQNWQILSVAGSEAPSVPGSLANTTEGAIVAQSASSGAAFDAFELTERTGSTAISPNNLLLVRDATTLQPLQSGGRDIFGLLQVESTFVDGSNFNDVSAGNRVKISFVRIDAAGTDLEACPVADIENEVIQYNYPSVVFFKNVDPSCFTGGRGFVDQAASVDVTLQNAYNNGNTIVTAGATDISFSGPEAGGGFTVSMVDAVSIGTANATGVDTSGTKLTLSTGDGNGAADGGDLDINAGDSGAGATGNGANVTVAAGTANSTSGNGGDATVQAGSSTGANEGGLVILTAGSSASGTNGYVDVRTFADNDEAQILLSPSGTGATVGFYSGAISPNAVVTANAGSIFLRSNGQVWVNTDGATAWSQLSTGSVEDRQDVYDNQGVTPVDLTTNAVLDLEAAGIVWTIRDDAEQRVFTVTEGSAGGTTQVQFGAATDTFDNDAVLNDFDGTTFDVDMTGSMTFDGGAASNFTTSAGDMTLESTAANTLIVAGLEADITAGTLVDINAGTGVDIDATTTVTIDTANAADASSNTITITAGSSTGGTNNGANIELRPGDGNATGVAGFVNINSAADEDEALLQLAATGTNGETVQMFAGSSDPNGTVTATRGSLFMRDTGVTGQLWINTDNGTTWAQLQSGATETRQDVYDNQGVTPVDLTTNAILDLEAAGIAWSIRDDAEANLFVITEGSAGGTSSVQIAADADTFDVDSPTQDFDGTTFSVDMTGAISLDAGAASNFTTADAANASANSISILAGSSTGGGNNGAPIVVTTGAADGAGQGGSMTLSTPDTADTASALSGAISISTGGTPFLGSNGSSGNLDLSTGTGSDSGVQAGRITLQTGSANAASGAIGGFINIIAGSSDATGEGGTMGDITITAGNNSGTDDAGDVTISTGTNTSAGGAAGAMTLNVGASTGAIAGVDVTINAGDAGATGATGGNVVVTTGAAAGGDAGFFYVDTDNDEDEHIVELSTSGTNGSDTQMLVGTTNPNGVINARPSSFYFRNTDAADGTPGAVFINVSDVAGESTVWSQVVTESTALTRTYASGVASGSISAGSDISDLAAASNITLDTNSPSFPTFPSTDATFYARVKVWVNGLLARNGVTVTRSGTQSTAIRLDFDLVSGDQVAIEQWSA